MSLLLDLTTVGGPVTATLTQTEQNDSLTSSATLAIQASLTNTEANDALSSTVVLAIQATLNSIEDNDALISTAVLAINASLSVTEDNDTPDSTAIVRTITQSGVSRLRRSLAEARKQYKIPQNKVYQSLNWTVSFWDKAEEKTVEDVKKALVDTEITVLLKEQENNESVLVEINALKTEFEYLQKLKNDKILESRKRAMLIIMLEAA